MRRNLQGLSVCVLGVGAFAILYLQTGWCDHACPSDFQVAVRLSLSAYRSFAGQVFALEYANDYDVALQPVFLYYTPIVPAAGGVIQLATGLDPYRSVLIVVAAMALSTSCAIYFTSRLLGAGPMVSGCSAATVAFSPYFLTDVFARGALTELSAWAALPWVMFFLLKFCSRPRLGSGILLIASTALLILCHKIFLPWALILFALLSLMLFGFRRVLVLAPALALCVLGALAVTAAYWANALLMLPHLAVSTSINAPALAGLTANLNLFWPLPYMEELLASRYSAFYLQLGPLIMLCLALSLLYLGDFRVRAFMSLTLAASLVVCSFFVAQGGWNYLPTQLTAIQFPYRLLIFATTFGTILAALVFTSVARSSPPYAAIGLAVAIAMLVGFYWSPSSVSGASVPTSEARSAAFASHDYYELDGPRPTVPVQSSVPRSAIKARGNAATATLQIEREGLAVLPVQYSRLLQVTVDGKAAEPFDSDGLVSLVLPAGTVGISIERHESVGLITGPCFAVAFIVALWLALRQFYRPRAPRAELIGAPGAA